MGFLLTCLHPPHPSSHPLCSGPIWKLRLFSLTVLSSGDHLPLQAGPGGDVPSWGSHSPPKASLGLARTARCPHSLSLHSAALLQAECPAPAEDGCCDALWVAGCPGSQLESWGDWFPPSGAVSPQHTCADHRCQAWGPGSRRQPCPPRRTLWQCQACSLRGTAASSPAP